jgi:hypothetical protein
MSMRSVVLVLLLAPASLAQLSEKQAVAQVKAECKQQLAEFKALGKAAAASLDADLKLVEAGLDENTTVSSFGNAVLSASADWSETVFEAWSTALQQGALSTSTALGQLANGGQLEGVYPESLYSGAGGVLDLQRKALAKSLVKLRDGAAKRLAKCATLAEKDAGLLLTTRLELPALRLMKGANQGELQSMDDGLGLDLVLAVSAADTADDGFLGVTGVCSSLDVVTVHWFRGFSADDSADVEPVVSGRFTATFSGLKEGAYTVSATRLIAVFEAAGEIGVR